MGSGSTIGNKMVTDERTNMVSFTGSPPVGRQIAKDAGMKMVTLELGNNSATIVEDDANLELAVQRVLAGGFANSGQICISVQRVIVHEAVYDEFLARLVPLVKALKVGDPLDETTDVATLISAAEVERVKAWVQEALDQGATLAAGGVREDGRLLPTVLTDVTREMKVCASEVFGPVISIIKARDLCEAIDISNDSTMGLQAGRVHQRPQQGPVRRQAPRGRRRDDQRGPDLPRRPHAIWRHQGFRHRPGRIEVRDQGNDRVEDGRDP